MGSSLLDQIPLFADLAPEAKDVLGAGFVEIPFPQGTVLLKAGEVGDALYLILKGFVSLSAPDGRSLATLGPGSIVGEMALFRHMPPDVNVTAVSDLDTWALTEARLCEILDRDPALALRLRGKLGDLPVQMTDYLLRRLEHTSSFAALPTPAIKALAAHMEYLELLAGEPILAAGKTPSGLFLLDRGAITLEVPGRSASYHPALSIGPGDLMGVLPLLADKPSSYNGVAMEDCLVWLLPAQAFHTLVAQYPALRRVLARQISAPLSEADQSVARSLLARSPLFKGMDPDTLQEIAAVMVLRHVAAGERVYTVDQSGDSMYFVEEGEVALSAEDIGGRVEEHGRVGPKECFGVQGLVSGQPYREDATALRHTTLWLLRRADLDEVCSRFPDMDRAIRDAAAAFLSAEKPDRAMDSLRQVALFAGLTEPELQPIAACLQSQKFAAGETIFSPGSPGDALYLLKDGQIRIQPREGASWLVNPGEEFGERALLHNAPHEESAVAEAGGEVWVLRQEDFAKLVARYPSLAYNLARLINQRLALMVSESRTVSGAEHVRSRSAWKGRDSGGHGGSIGIATVGKWISSQTLPAKLGIGLLALMAFWGVLLGTLVAWQSLRGAGTSLASSMDVASAVRAVQSMGSYELAKTDTELAKALAMADQLAPPTPLPTLPATTTPTPLPTATPTQTPLPTATPTATDTPRPVVVLQAAPQAAAPPPEPEAQVAALPPRAWDPRLDRLGVVIEEPAVPSGQPYWRLVEAQWQDEQEAEGRHHIYVEVLDENGKRIVGQPVTAYWADGNFTAATEDKPPPNYAFNYQMYATGNAYHVKVEGLPSDIVHGVGLGDLERPRWSIHTSFLLTFQKTTKP